MRRPGRPLAALGSTASDAPPGDYELWAFESSAKDGSITWLDTTRITLR